MKNIILILAAVALIVSFNSCKKCYSCNKTTKRYCADVEVTSLLGVNNFSQCFDTEEARDNFATTTESTAAQLMATAVTTKSDTITFNRTVEVCGSSDDAKNFTLLWENDGYTCTDK